MAADTVNEGIVNEGIETITLSTNDNNTKIRCDSPRPPTTCNHQFPPSPHHQQQQHHDEQQHNKITSISASPPRLPSPPPPPPPPASSKSMTDNVVVVTAKKKDRKQGEREKKLSLINRSNRNNNNKMHYSYWNPKPRNKCIGENQECVYLICDDYYMSLCDKNDIDKNKYSIFWQLIKAYNLDKEETFGKKLKIIPPIMATREDLLSYHDENYISLLETVENYPEYSYQTEEEKEILREYGLIDDNPIFDGLYEYCLNITGSSLKCAQLIRQNKTRIAMNFGGGRHHAFSSKANGFCYVNDIILCIDSLRNDEKHRFNKILYIDIDVHHCDSIQEAYYQSNDVFVVSIHHKDITFFPQNTGDKNKFGEKNGMFYNLNIPIHKNLRLRDDAFCDIISKICHRLNYYFQPDAIVICCGCDGLQSDPENKWNLSINGITKAVNIIITQMDKPTIILGGGGYNPYDTAKCWTKIVAQTANINISNDIPYHDNFPQFTPHYQLNKMKPLLTMTNNNGNNNNIILDRKKQQKINIHAMQIIYGHLNNFERLFVQKILKKSNKNDNEKNKNKNKNKNKKKNNNKNDDNNKDILNGVNPKKKIKNDKHHHPKETESDKIMESQPNKQSEEEKDTEKMDINDNVTENDNDDDGDIDMDIDNHNDDDDKDENNGNENENDKHDNDNDIDDEDIDLNDNNQNDQSSANEETINDNTTKKRQFTSITTNTCRSRRKRRKLK